jgi:hypothetical protein
MLKELRLQFFGIIYTYAIVLLEFLAGIYKL